MHLLPKFFESHAGSNFNFSVAAATGKPLVQLDQAVNQLTPGSPQELTGQLKQWCTWLF